MKIGIAAATLFEIQPTINFLAQSDAGQLPHEFVVLVTGIGSLASAYNLTNFITRQAPDYMVQAGIGGSFTETLPPGETVLIGEEILGDLGAEENNLFIDLFDMGLMEPSVHPYTNKRLLNPHIMDWEKYGLPVATGITVNEITTLQTRINIFSQKYNCEIESMEGGAFHYVCLQENIPFIQFRSVSNYVGDRNKNTWKLKESIENLNNTLIKILQQIPLA
ncbi:MAG: futalosine hydrolase [Chitinophagaceae bacterium]